VALADPHHRKNDLLFFSRHGPSGRCRFTRDGPQVKNRN
jgi:hypothetical protein